MSQYLIGQSPRLSGEVSISTSKNAVLPILAAALLTHEEIIIHQVPNLTDTCHMAEILKVCGAEVSFCQGDMRIRALSIGSPKENSLLRTMRASVLVLGPLAARTGECELSMPGGCAIGQRPIDLHLKGLQKLGAKVELDGGIARVSGGLKGANIYLDFPSVGATENILLASVLADGHTRIENAAKEPEIIDLCMFLRQMGAEIEGVGTGTLYVTGQKQLHGCVYRPIPDRIEAGTILCAAAMTDGSVLLRNACPEHMRAVLFKLKEAGVSLRESSAGLRISGRAIHPFQVRTLAYPGFPTDMQAPMMALALKMRGTSVFLETIFENRFMHAREMARLGAHIRIEDRIALVNGGQPLAGATVNSTDLRGGAAMILAGMAAEGETLLQDPQGHIARGYEDLPGMLSALGADVTVMDWNPDDANG